MGLLDIGLPKEAATVEEAAAVTDTSPSDAQIEAGNYRKGKCTVHGLEIAIENPKGSTRSGTSKSGKKWSVTMTAHYGYILGTTGKDKDHLDVFIADDDASDKVFVINQVNPDTENFDEHKIVLCCKTQEEAEKLYLSNYEKGWKGLGSVKAMTVDEFKKWILEGNHTKEASYVGSKSTTEIGNSVGWLGVGLTSLGCGSGPDDCSGRSSSDTFSFGPDATAARI